MKKSKNKKITLKKILFIVLFFCLTGGGIYSLIFSPFFRIKEISISGNQEVATIDIENIVRHHISGKKFWLLPKNNIFLLDPDKLVADLKDNFIKIFKVVISSRNAPRRVPRLEIEITERQAQAIVCHYHYQLSRDATSRVSTDEEGSERQFEEEAARVREVFDDCFYVDGQGIAFKPAPQTKGSLIILAGASYDINLGWEAAKPHLLSTMSQINNKLREKIPDLAINYFLIQSAQELRLKTRVGWQIYFDALADIDYQTTVLKELLSEKIKDTKNLEYIDLRMRDKVYYKNREL